MRGPDYIEAELTDRLKACREQLAECQKDIKSVRKLHRKVEGPGFHFCEHCDRISGGIFGAGVWPYPTIQAMDEEQL